MDRPDLPLWPRGPIVGLGLWNSLPGTIFVEGTLFAGCFWLYLGLTSARDTSGRWGLIMLVSAAVLIWAMLLWFSPPQSSKVIAWGAMLLWLLPPWAQWIELHRQASSARI